MSALQWAVGLELFLLSKDPWRVVLSTDHPNGGSFLAYPQLIQLLMDRSVRDEALKRVNQKLLAGSALLDGLAREYTLNEIAIVTRAGPARLLGLPRQGPPRPGRRRRRDDLRAGTRTWRRCSRARATCSRVAASSVEEGQLRRAPRGGRLHVRPGYDDAVLTDVRRFFDAHATVRFENYPGARACRESRYDRSDTDEPPNAHPRHADRGHLRRGVHHAGRAADHHRRVAALGQRRGAQAHRVRDLGDRLQVRGGDRAACSSPARRPTAGPA